MIEKGKKESSSLTMEVSLDNIRKQINTTLLFSLRSVSPPTPVSALSYDGRERLNDLPKEIFSTLQESVFDYIKISGPRHYELLHAMSKSDTANSSAMENFFSERIGYLA